MAERTIKVRVVGDAASLNRTFKQTSSSASRFGSAMAKVGKIAAVGFAGAVAGASVVLVKSARAALEAEKAQTRLDAAFKSANVSARQRAQAMETVSRISNKAALDDEDLADALGRLTRVTGDAEEAQRSLAIAADVSRGRGISLEAATQLVTKAHLGQVGALKRVGIEIPKVTAAQDALRASGAKATVEQTKAAKAADEAATRQAAVAALQEQYAGASEKYGQTASGAMERFQVASENLQESLGSALLPVLAKVAGGAADFIDKFNKAEGAGAKFRVVMDGVKGIAERTWKALGDAVRNIDWAHAATVIRDGIYTTIGKMTRYLSDAVSRINWGEVGRVFGQNTVKALQAIGAAIRAVNWEEFGRTVVRRIGQFLASVDWIAVLAATFRLLVAAVKAQVLIVKGIAEEIGRALVQGIISGIISLKDTLLGWVEWLADLIPGWLKGFLGIGSPAKATIPIGAAVVEGIISGFEQNAAKLEGAARTVVERVIDAAKTAIDNRRGLLSDAVAQLSGDVLAAFDKIETESEKKLRRIREARDQAARQSELKEAKQGVWNAIVTGDPQQYADAVKRLRDAEWAIEEAALEKKAAQEREKKTLERTNLEERLTALNTNLETGRISIDTWHKRIVQIMKEHGIPWKKGAAELGLALAKGLRESLKDVEKAADALARAIETRLNKIKVSVTVGISSKGAVEKRQHGGPVRAGHPYMVGEAGPELFVPRMSGGIVPHGQASMVSAGGGNTYVFNFPNYVGDRRELTEAMRVSLADIARRNGGSSLPGVA